MGNTVIIPDVELFQAGRHGPQQDEYSIADLHRMAEAAERVGFCPPLKVGQAGADGLLKPPALPALGWVRNLRVKGQKLVGDLTDVPRRVAELIRTGQFTRLAAEIYHNFSQNGQTWPLVFKAVSLLGAAVPTGTLKDIEALYGAKTYAADLPPGEAKVYHGEIQVVSAGSRDSSATSSDRRHAEGERTMPKVTLRYLSDADRAEAGAQIAELAKQYRIEHPAVSYEAAVQIVALANPETWNAYVSPEAPPLGDAMFHYAGEDLLDAARRLQKSHPGMDIETATEQAMMANVELSRTYAGFSPPGEIITDEGGARAGDSAASRIQNADDTAVLRGRARARIIEKARINMEKHNEMVARKMFGTDGKPMTLAMAVRAVLGNPDYSADAAVCGDMLRAEFGISVNA